MNYNWPEIMKDKSIKELYDIAIDNSVLDEEAQKSAEKELNNRNLFLDNPSKIKAKIELETLLKEQEIAGSKSGYFFNFGTKDFFYQFLAASLLFVGSLIGLINDYPKVDKIKIVLLLFFSLAFAGFTFYQYRKAKKREVYRKQRIKELTDNI